VQIPQVGREWEDILEAYAALSYLAAVTQRCRLGALVTGITYRNIALLGKIVATLDVLSKGRAVCGLGAAWFEREHRSYGWAFPPARERLDLLEDALRLLPLLWGPGAPAFEGLRITVPEAICYPRPLQEHVPILVGGSGERRTLKLVAQYADACNLVGEADVVRAKLGVLRRHCADAGRDPAEIQVTHFSPVMVGDPGATPPPPSRALPGTAEDHIGRFRGLAEAGVQTAIVALADLGGTEPIERFAEVIAAFAKAG
jgi:alkanesulfonate monooxygenase SsuD/methylene tetrahydromethanopterin reductase-like flavin-dependent oxidoreductase (luciferase family)